MHFSTLGRKASSPKEPHSALIPLSAAKKQPNGCLREFEGLPELVDEIALVRKMDGFGAIAEKNKRRRSHGALSGIIEFQSASRNHRRLMF
jgi:hypothetical protein